ncbi:MAG: hypothetical protein ACK5X3_12195 [Pseudomonadota bacterium]|jgi:hypothetical protein
MEPYEPTEADLREMNREFLAQKIEIELGREAVELLVKHNLLGAI